MRNDTHAGKFTIAILQTLKEEIRAKKLVYLMKPEHEAYNDACDEITETVEYMIQSLRPKHQIKLSIEN